MKGDRGAERTYTADDLARLCGLPVAVVRRWIVRGLLVPICGSVRQFSFRAVGAARTLAQLRRAGWSPTRIWRAWQLARTVVPDAYAALSGLLASIGRPRVTVRTPDGRLVEPGGQLLFDFDTAAAASGAQPRPLRSARDWFGMGVDAEAAGRIDDAIRAYEQALPGGFAETHFNLGNCYYARRRRQEALTQFRAAVAAAPDYAEAWNNLAVVSGELGDRQGAIDALVRALELVPHYADAHYNLAEALALAGDLERARHHWRAYLTFDPNSRWADQVRRRLQHLGGAWPGRSTSTP